MQRNHEKRARLQDEKTLGLLIMVWIYRAVLLVLMMAGVCKFGVLPIGLMSGDCMIILGAYITLLTILQDIYHACEIGQARISELIMSQLLAGMISTGVLYMCVVLYEHMFFNPTGLLAVMGLQLCVGIVWTILMNNLYFKRHRQPRTAVIFRKEADVEMLYRSPYFLERFNVVKRISQSDSFGGGQRISAICADSWKIAKLYSLSEFLRRWSTILQSFAFRWESKDISRRGLDISLSLERSTAPISVFRCFGWSVRADIASISCSRDCLISSYRRSVLL